MNWLELQSQQLLIFGSAALFFAGFLLGMLLARRRKTPKSGEDPRNHRIRELEADVRLLRRQLEEARSELNEKSEACEVGTATVRDLNALLEQKDAQVSDLRREVKSAVAKTRELRQELTDRAAESIREHVRAEEARTELDVMRAGSDAVLSEYTRLQEEREQLSGRMAELERELLSEKELLGSAADKD